MMFAGASVSLFAVCSMAGANETSLNDMTQLYQYALEQAYAYGTYDVFIQYVDNGEYGYPEVTTEHLS